VESKTQGEMCCLSAKGHSFCGEAICSSCSPLRYDKRFGVVIRMAIHLKRGNLFRGMISRRDAETQRMTENDILCASAGEIPNWQDVPPYGGSHKNHRNRNRYNMNHKH